jgi:two-component system, LytTR family, sensor kinase
MKAKCERCARLLPQDGKAYVCSFECTFCVDCASAKQNICPNCGGELVLRPRRRDPVAGDGNEDTAAPLRIRPQVLWAASFGVWGFVALAGIGTTLAYQAVIGRPLGPVAGLLLSQFLTYAPLTPFAFALALRYPIQRGNWARRSLLYLAAGLIFSLAHVILKTATPYGYWDSTTRQWSSGLWNSNLHRFREVWVVIRSMFMGYVVNDITGAFIPILLVAHVVSYYQRAREKERRTTQLEGELAKARLQTLKTQLQPHFLFNTLHSISALMLTDVSGADRMMTSLSDLLRMSLEDNGSQLTLLSREVEFLNVYVDIEKVRFRDRLRVVLDVPPECFDALVPPLLLQPLVENAIRHGISRRSKPGEVRVVAKNAGHHLEIWVCDDGPGLADPPEKVFQQGIGLSVTRDRLLALYGADHSFEIRNAPEGGVEVHLRVPLNVAAKTTTVGAITYG